MKLLTYIYSKDELNNLSSSLVVNLKDYSFKYEKNFTKDEILEIKNLGKEVYLNLNCLYSDSELDSLEIILKELNNLDGYIVGDLGLVSILNSLGLKDKIIYAPETFITNELDSKFFDIKKYMISREIDLESIKDIISNKKDTMYLFKAFGYQLLSYSKRKHITNFKDIENININDEFNLFLKEETRIDPYRIIEDNHGTRIYKDKIFNAYSYLDSLKDVDYLLLDRIFISDEMYYDTVKLFSGSNSNYFNKYQNFETAYLESQVGLLKEDTK